MTTDAKIKITGDPKEANEAFKEVSKSADSLNDHLGTIAATSGVISGALVGAIGVSIAAFRKQEQAVLKQNAILKATGFAAGLTGKELRGMASALQSVTTFGDEVIIGGQNLLLTFKEIGKDVFPQATETMLDMSAALGQDLKSSAIQLGKALNDPMKGITALSRVGVSFNKQQKEQIKTFQESGQMAKAQAVILNELKTEFGGTARAAAEGTGTFIQMQNSIGDLMEDVGKQFVPFLSAAAKGVSEFIDTVREHEEVAKITARVLLFGAALTGIVATAAVALIGFAKIRGGLAVLRIHFNATRISATLMWGAVTLGASLLLTFLPEIIAGLKEILSLSGDTGTIDTLDGINKKLNQLKNQRDAITNAIEMGAIADEKEAKVVIKNIDFKIEQLNKLTDERKGLQVEWDKPLVLQTSIEGDLADPNSLDELFALPGDKKVSIPMELDESDVVNQASDIAKELTDIEVAKNELINLERARASSTLIDLKRQEINALTQIEKAKSEQDKELAQLNLERILEDYDFQKEILAEKRAEDFQTELDTKFLEQQELSEVDKQSLEKTKIQMKSNDVSEQKLGKLRFKRLVAQKKAENAAISSLEKQRMSNALNLAAATGDAIIAATGDNALASLALSKGFAVADVLIKSSMARVSAMAAAASAASVAGPAAPAVFATTLATMNGLISLNTGLSLGAIGAQTFAAVARARLGGVVQGIGSGDRVPMMLEPGEIVVPKALSPNFQEQFSLNGNGKNGSNQPQLTIHNNFNGTVIGEDEWVEQNLIPKIYESVKYNNADLGYEPA